MKLWFEPRNVNADGERPGLDGIAKRLAASAANLKFLSVLQQVLIGTSNSKPHWDQYVARAPLIPKFAKEIAAI